MTHLRRGVRQTGCFGPLLALSLAAAPATQPIDRHALVSRHDVVFTAPDPFGALSVGNGSFAFNFDVTGLQTFPDHYAKTTPLGVLSDWGWHAFPNPDGFSMDTFHFKTVPKNGRTFSYPAAGTVHTSPQAAYLRSNPQRIGLGLVGLAMTKADGSPVAIADLTQIHQHLDLWDGCCDSAFAVGGQPVRVTTVASQDKDQVAVRIDSPMIAAGRLKVRIAFPYASTSFGPDYNDWTHPDAHVTTLTPRGDHGADFARSLDATRYAVRLHWEQDGVTLTPAEKHVFVLAGHGDALAFTMRFSPDAPTTENDDVDAVRTAAAAAWHAYWSHGGVIDFSGTADPRAAELERRLVLSQYVMAVHDAGHTPPQETGLAANSWYGKFHMEMFWWHAAHWATWGRPELLERSLDSLTAMMPANAKIARLEGCSGVKWPKMTDPTGVESPSGVGPVLVWQQPHPIYLAELVYRAKKDRATLDRYKDIVFATADYMADFVDFDKTRGEYVLGPGVSAGDEKHTDVVHNLNPTMEVQYWKWTLMIAQEWRKRLGLEPNPKWADVIARFAKPTVRGGVYPALEIPVETKPAFLTTFMYGAFAGPDVDPQVMRATLHGWHQPVPQNEITWGTAMAAMCAARLDEPDRAVDLLVGRFDTNPFRPNGYTVRRPDQTPMYMPANGGWLVAAAMMAAGWDGCDRSTPGFPKDWVVRSEGLVPLP
jgi:hypothetical protein